MRKHANPFAGTTGLREEQKKSINYFSRPTQSTKQHDGLRNKRKYWCPENKIWYIKTPRHEYCPLCNSNHDIIEFDRKIHEL